MKIESKQKAGFTLIEIMVAMLVLAIGLLGLAGITVVVLRSNTVAQQVNDATNIAADLMDSLRRADPGSLGTATNCITPIAFTSGQCPAIEKSGLYNLGSNQNDYYPQPKNAFGDTGASVACGVSNVLSASNAYTFDIVNSQLQEVQGFQAGDSFCTMTQDSRYSNLPAKQFWRYYRTYWPGGSAGANDRTIVVVVAWRYRNQWKNVHLSTSQ
ncbi:MAG: type pilus modification protein PilV [Bacteriovoracaceae bacterium]|nr:type pilus modification protein PilV [Bacteriovoracaceae bacterium]